MTQESTRSVDQFAFVFVYFPSVYCWFPTSNHKSQPHMKFVRPAIFVRKQWPAQGAKTSMKNRSINQSQQQGVVRNLSSNLLAFIAFDWLGWLLGAAMENRREKNLEKNCVFVCLVDRWEEKLKRQESWLYFPPQDHQNAKHERKNFQLIQLFFYPHCTSQLYLPQLTSYILYIYNNGIRWNLYKLPFFTN